ncbi:MAG: tRNA N6-adenosine(37)-N6-threonylcarbamoyltransferase complex dimerization subunit TsaB [Desulfobacterales bacterium C00003060]|nr:MAG: tRNA N6-adenosine(37)-N6-threonylcarbamoyltransferase complex dimerization subunit TsaB [Desulfobacterales bacterium S3730MH5]OEU79425.1 MAG: tRNA N6-adenosine(37)-N6-threonylcarbamoyltransferase complex dimerization subunit TsaB [Desulfobacterales bacterium C00003060]OEU84706.1 MAG: tRNA N6-adenosine(37)-N6-threonylcarbamoyltransferase complex dimerization subunit TsaB [Desulfobacterales bacterium S5133MH4]
MIILGVDTSVRTGSVAVLKGDTVLAEIAVTSAETHAKRLMSAVDDTLRMAGLTIAECDGFAVTTGPGSFTGLRIGISAVKGLGFATKKPVTGVSTLDALAYQFPSFPHLICPILDACKGEIYTALHECTGFMKWKIVVGDCAAEPREWLGQIQRFCLFVGNGTLVYGRLIKETLGDLAHFAPPYLNTVRAPVVAYIGMKQIHAGRIADLASLAPHYIRKSDAEINLEKLRTY